MGWSSGAAEDGPQPAVPGAGAPPGADARAEIDRLLALGARRADTAAVTGEGESRDVPMLDPDGNEFSVRMPR